MKKALILFGILIFLLTGCSDETPVDPYTGRDLKIGIIGAPPDILENDKVKFFWMDFEDLTNGNYKNYDAVFIMQAFLPHASASKYADLYMKLDVPIIFVGADSLTSFITNDQEYDPKGFQEGLPYSVGIINGTEYEFGLYNDQEIKETKQLFYSDLFRLIE